MTYATVEEVSAGFRPFDSEEQEIAAALLDEAAVIIDAYNSKAGKDAKKVVSCRMVRRAIPEKGGTAFPLGSSQGSVSAMGYSQSFTFSNGSTGELYLSKVEKKLLGVGNKIGTYNPVEEMMGND